MIMFRGRTDERTDEGQSIGPTSNGSKNNSNSNSSSRTVTIAVIVILGVNRKVVDIDICLNMQNKQNRSSRFRS